MLVCKCGYEYKDEIYFRRDYRGEPLCPVCRLGIASASEVLTVKDQTVILPQVKEETVPSEQPEEPNETNEKVDGLADLLDELIVGYEIVECESATLVKMQAALKRAEVVVNQTIVERLLSVKIPG